MQHRSFSSKKPLKFKCDKDLIFALRSIFGVEGCFYMCSCHEDQKVKFVMNLLHLGAKDWLEFMI